MATLQIATKDVLKAWDSIWEALPEGEDKQEACDVVTMLEGYLEDGGVTMYNIYHPEFKHPERLSHKDFKLDWNGETFYMFTKV